MEVHGVLAPLDSHDVLTFRHLTKMAKGKDGEDLPFSPGGGVEPGIPFLVEGNSKFRWFFRYKI